MQRDPRSAERQGLVRRYTRSLDPEHDNVPPYGEVWPAGIERVPYDFGLPIAAQCLDDEYICRYLQTFGSDGYAPAEFIGGGLLPEDWKSQTYPLILCEFLAYKAALAYKSEAEIKSDLLGLARNGTQLFNTPFHAVEYFDTTGPNARMPFTDTQGFAFVLGRVGYVVMRGTESWADMRTNRHDEPTSETFDELSRLEQRAVGGKWPPRHTGFAVAWGCVAPDIEDWVRRHRHEFDQLVFSGHSLGGALAILGARHFASQDRSLVGAVITFGAPMVGGRSGQNREPGKDANTDFRHEYDEMLGLKDRTLRLEAAEDFVTIVTRRWGVYEHVGQAWRFKERPLRNTAMMWLLSPLYDAEEKAREQVEKLEEKRRKQAEAMARQKEAPTWGQRLSAYALKALWWLAKRAYRAWSAHSVERRYALYLSTLAYRKIRYHHVELARLAIDRDRSHLTEKLMMRRAYEEAEKDLTAHLCNARGRHPRTFRVLRKRPVRIASRDDVLWYAKYFEEYIA